MSYILDALRKSEQERHRGEIPTASSIAMTPPAAPSRRAWPRVLLVGNVAVLVLVAAMAWHARGPDPGHPVDTVAGDVAPQRPEVPAQAATGPPPAAPPVATATPVSAAPLDAAAAPSAAPVPASLQPVPVAPPPPPAMPSPNVMPVLSLPAPPPLPMTSAGETVIVPPASSPAEPIRLADAPEPLRSELAQLVFSTHVHADDAAFRAVTIGGRRFREGDAITPSGVVEAITEEGIVIRAGTVRVYIDIVRSWNG